MLRLTTPRVITISIGRNDPCPCGSGKKFKKCCGAIEGESLNLKYDGLRALDAEVSAQVLRFAIGRFGEHVLDDAWGDFILSDENSHSEAHPEADYFERWFTFDWRPTESESLAELFLADRSANMREDIRTFINLTRKSPYSYLQTLDAKPGEILTLRDIFRKREFHVMERSASAIAGPGMIMFARVVEMNGICFIMGCGGFVIPPTHLDFLLELRTEIETEGTLGEHPIADETLVELEEELRETYLDLADKLQNTRPEVRNTDGDPLAFCTLTYDIPSLDEAFNALKDLEQKVTGAPDSRMIAGIRRDEAKGGRSVVLHWLKRQKGEGGGNTTLAILRIDESTLVVETNSEKRSARVKKEISKRLGPGAVLIRTEVASHEGLMKDLAENPIDPSQHEESENDRILKETPEVKAMLKGMIEKHWETWPDIPVPALRGMTPRRAAKDPVGRELLESLLLGFETQNRRNNDENLRVDIEKLRAELGLDSGKRV